MGVSTVHSKKFAEKYQEQWGGWPSEVGSESILQLWLSFAFLFNSSSCLTAPVNVLPSTNKSIKEESLAPAESNIFIEKHTSANVIKQTSSNGPLHGS